MPENYPFLGCIRVVGTSETPLPVRRLEFLAKNVMAVTPYEGKPFIINYYNPEEKGKLEVYGLDGWE